MSSLHLCDRKWARMHSALRGRYGRVFKFDGNVGLVGIQIQPFDLSKIGLLYAYMTAI